MDDLIRRLREAADAHQPDRAHMLARVERGMARPPGSRHRERTVAPWRRIVLAVVIALGTVTAGSFAVAAIVQAPPPHRPGTGAAVSSPSTTTAPVPSPHPGHPSVSATAGPRTSPPSTGPSAQDGALSATGSIDPHSNPFWSQSDLILQTARPLTALTVELRVAQTGGVKSTGTWRTLPASDFTVEVRQDSGGLHYRWTLKPGRTVPAGRHEFAAQYDHATGTRAAQGDTYRVDATGPRGAATIRGGFTAAG